MSLDQQGLDPNDFLLADLCIRENAIILTDDHDFCSDAVQCDLITNNQRLLQDAQQNGFILAN